MCCYNIKNDPERISNIEPFIKQYNWIDIKFSSHQEHWKKFEQNNKTIALNILYVPHNTKQIRLAYKSKYNYKRNNQVNLLMITNGKKWHYLVARSLSALLRGITSNHIGDIYCLNCFHSYRSYNKLRRHEKVCHKYDYCLVEIPKEDEKILKQNHGKMSLKVQFTIHLDLQCLIKKEQSWQINLENSYTERKAEHEPSGWAMFTKCSFDEIENRFDYSRERDCIKKLYEKVRNQ